MATRITGNEEDGEEAVQDAFWNVVRKVDTFRGDAAFGSWVPCRIGGQFPPISLLYWPY